MEKNVTITQIARECGTSIATVSRVLNGSENVASETRKRVESVIQKYNFSPNAFARGLISRQSMTLGVITPDITNPYFSAMYTEIERSALNAGYSMILCNTRFSSTTHGGISHEGASLKGEEAYFQMMIDKKVDGVLVIGGQIDLMQVCDDYRHALQHLGKSVPVVVIGRPLEGMDCLFIERETGSGVATAVSYLASLGHRNIAFVGGEEGVIITETRVKAYRSTLEALGLPHSDSLISLSDYYAPDGYQAAAQLLERGTRFTAMVAINDSVAMGAVRALADHDILVPKDVALISCDQFPSAEYLVPRLTSIDQHNELFGSMVIQTLLCAVKGVGEPAKLTFTPELVVRESCGTKLGMRHFPD